MGHSHATRALLLLALCAGAAAAPGTPSSSDVVRARVALRYDAVSRCPEVRAATPDDETVVLVRFRVGSTGVPSKASIGASSGSADLDAAAMSCVLRLRFQPATRLGDGEPIDSWQEMSWRAAPVHRAASLAAPQAPSTAAGPATAATAPPDSARVQVCADEAGKVVKPPALLHSSGNADFDAAALNIARAASGAYRPALQDGRPAAGCVQLTIGPDTSGVP